MKPIILVVDDDSSVRIGLKKLLEMDNEYTVLEASHGKEGLEVLRSKKVDLVILDLKMPIMSGEEMFEELKKRYPDLPVIILTGHGTIENAVDFIKEGAVDFLEKPTKAERINVIIKNALKISDLQSEVEELKDKLREKYGITNIIGNSKKMQEIFDLIKIVAPTKSNILITGENGTGKELVANAIHYLSTRKDNPFVKVHCAALNENLLESELFGHEKGAFTGASSRKKGRFELADGGTLFLDEIGEISMSMQVKLLRVLQEREFERVGGEKTLKVDVRIIAATNKNLETLIEKGEFREDLYYRLKVISIEMPPLRERKEDIYLLINAFIKEYSQLNGKNIDSITNKARAYLEAYGWPGNVRELRNVIERAVVITQGNTITEKELPSSIVNQEQDEYIKIKPNQPLDEIEKEVILSTLANAGGNKSKTASILKIGRKTLQRKLEQYEKKNNNSL